MTFSDDDLKRLKRGLEVIDYPFRSEFLGIIARLEAAERYAWCQDPINGPLDEKPIYVSREAWRKAVGK